MSLGAIIFGVLGASMFLAASYTDMREQEHMANKNFCKTEQHNWAPCPKPCEGK